MRMYITPDERRSLHSAVKLYLDNHTNNINDKDWEIAFNLKDKLQTDSLDYPNSNSFFGINSAAEYDLFRKVIDWNKSKNKTNKLDNFDKKATNLYAEDVKRLKALQKPLPYRKTKLPSNSSLNLNAFK